MWAHSEKEVLPKLQSLHQEPNQQAPWAWTPELWEKNCLLFDPPTLWHFVVIAQTNWYIILDEHLVTPKNNDHTCAKSWKERFACIGQDWELSQITYTYTQITYNLYLWKRLVCLSVNSDLLLQLISCLLCLEAVNSKTVTIKKCILGGLMLKMWNWVIKKNLAVRWPRQ